MNSFFLRIEQTLSQVGAYDIFRFVVGSMLLVLLIAALAFILVSEIVLGICEYRRRSAEKKKALAHALAWQERHPDALPVEIKARDAEGRMLLRVFTVNEEEPVFSDGKLLLPLGEVTLRVCRIRHDSTRRYYAGRRARFEDIVINIKQILHRYRRLFRPLDNKEQHNRTLTYGKPISFSLKRDYQYQLCLDRTDGELHLIAIKNDKSTVTEFSLDESYEIYNYDM